MEAHAPRAADAPRYTLQPYTGPESRHTCPQCGRAGSFVLYIDTATGSPLADYVGRCNRQDSCGYHYKPRQYFIDHPEQAAHYEPPKRTKSRPLFREWEPGIPPQLYTIPRATIAALLRTDKSRLLSELSVYLRTTLGPRYAAIQRAYYLCSFRGAAVFWYVDQEGRIRTGKKMHYLTNGHRNKDWPPSYIHSRLKADGKLPKEWTLRRCLFGEHLLRSVDPATPVALVESEKTALIGAALCPGPIWLATGGKQCLNADSCAALTGRKVIAYPDLQALNEWQQKLADLSRKVNFTFEVSDILERIATAEDRAAGLDIADYLLQA